MFRVKRVRCFAGRKVKHRRRRKVDCQFIRRSVRILCLVGRILTKWRSADRVIMLDEQCNGGCYDGRGQLCIRISAHLLHRGQYRCQQGNAAPLPGTFPLGDTQDVRFSRFFVAGFYPRPCQGQRIIIGQRVPAGYPVGNDCAVFVRFHALNDLVHIDTVHLAGIHSVCAVRTAHLVSLDQPELQGIRPVPTFFELHCCKYVTVHQEAGECQCLQPPEVIHAACIAGRTIRPQAELAGNFRLQMVSLFLGQVQIVRIDLGCRHKAAPHHISAQGLDCAGRQWDTHVSIPAPLAQCFQIVLDVLFCTAAANVPAPHRAGCVGSAIVPVTGAVVYDRQRRAGHSAAIPLFGGDCRNGLIKEIRHVLHLPYTSCGEKW